MTKRQSSRSQDRKLRPIRVPADIALLYESKDGKLCLFEDSTGHLTAVRAAKLA